MKQIIALFLLFHTLEVFAQTITPIGQPQLLFSNNGETFISPKFSVDGKNLAFTKENFLGIYVYNFQNKSTKQITDEPAAGYGYSWSADSKSILARVSRFEDKKEISAVKLFQIDEMVEKILIDYRSSTSGLPRFISSDRQIMFPGKNKMEIINTGIKNSNLGKSIFPDKELWQEGTEIYYGNPLTNEFVKLDPIPGAQYINLVLSPDKTKAAFEVYGGNMFSMNISGIGLIDLGKGERPQWSPESNYLVYMNTQDDGHQFLASDIFTIKSDGTEKTQITFSDDMIEMNPCWAPDGRRIAFNDMKSGSIYLIEITR
ncbi:MAG: hypothetical protein NTX22_01440 [Ignavibacteriales bacterium]|nr:hypothetical protein [Ignavibacteriales bacterium]